MAYGSYREDPLSCSQVQQDGGSMALTQRQSYVSVPSEDPQLLAPQT